MVTYTSTELPYWLSGKESTCQCRRHGFSPWVRKIPWRRKWQVPPVLLPGNSHGQRSLAGYSPWGRKELDMTGRLHFHLRQLVGLFVSYLPMTLYNGNNSDLAKVILVLFLKSRWKMQNAKLLHTCIEKLGFPGG